MRTIRRFAKAPTVSLGEDSGGCLNFLPSLEGWRYKIRRRERAPFLPAHRKKGLMSTRSQIIGRLHRLEGQVRGVARMIDKERHCIDVLTQLWAVRSALAHVEIEMLKTT